MKTQVELKVEENIIELLEGLINNLKEDFKIRKSSYIVLDFSFDDKDYFDNQITVGFNHYTNIEDKPLRLILSTNQSEFLASSLNTMHKMSYQELNRAE